MCRIASASLNFLHNELMYSCITPTTSFVYRRNIAFTNRRPRLAPFCPLHGPLSGACILAGFTSWASGRFASLPYTFSSIAVIGSNDCFRHGITKPQCVARDALRSEHRGSSYLIRCCRCSRAKLGLTTLSPIAAGTLLAKGEGGFGTKTEATSTAVGSLSRRSVQGDALLDLFNS